MPESIVIVGAGECGTRAALALRDEGFKGPLTLIGSEPGAPYERPPLSKEPAAPGHGFRKQPIATEERLAGLGITFLHSSPASAIDRKARRVCLQGGTSIGYSRLLIATGAIPRKLPISVPDKACQSLRSFEDALDFRRRMQTSERLLVVGGGLIGLELAALARKAGLGVTVIESQPRILGRSIGAETAGVLAGAHASAGVEIRCNTSVRAMDHDGTSVRAELSDTEIISADFVVIAIGVTPDTGLAESAGLAIENGILVDGRLRTRDPHIFAAGDCCAVQSDGTQAMAVRHETWSNANDQGSFSAKSMLGSGANYTSIPWFWSDQLGLTVRVVGNTDGAVQTVTRETGDTSLTFHLGEDGRLLAAAAIGPALGGAREILLARHLIAAGVHPCHTHLRDPGFNLKSLL